MAAWLDYVQSMANWFQTNIHTYQGHIAGSKTPVNTDVRIPCNLLGGGKVRDDCSGFVSACLQYAGIFPAGVVTNSAGFKSTTGRIAQYLQNGGFTAIAFNRASLQPGDIYAVNNGVQHHVEIYAGKLNGRDMTYSWGRVHDTASGGMPSAFAPLPYTVIWRQGGANLSGTIINGTFGGGVGLIGGSLDNYEVVTPRNEQKDNILIKDIFSLRKHIFATILEGEGVICTTAKDFNNKSIFEDTFFKKHNGTYDELRTKTLYRLYDVNLPADIHYTNDDKSISEFSVDIAKTTLLANFMTPGGFIGNFTGFDAQTVNTIEQLTNDSNDTTYKNNVKLFIQLLQQYGHLIGLNPTGMVVLLGLYCRKSRMTNMVEKRGSNSNQAYWKPVNGKVYCGRGPAQVTWDHTYKKIYKEFFVPNGLGQYNVGENPDLANDPKIGILLTIGYFAHKTNAVQAMNQGLITSARRCINAGSKNVEKWFPNVIKFANAFGVNVNLYG